MTRKLPVAGQYAAKRADKPGSYVLAEVPVCGGRWTLYVDGNSKVTGANAATTGGMGGGLAALDPFTHPAPNAFSLPHIATCPGSTPSCRASCYVSGLQANAPELYARYADNERALHGILESAHSFEAAWVLASWITVNAPHGFRWHVSGDVFSSKYATWIQDVCYFSPNVRHWIYTRSYRYATILAQASNLTVNLSVDRDNHRDVLDWLTDRYPDDAACGSRATFPFRLCYMCTEDELPPADLPDGSVVFPDYANRGRDLEPDARSHPWWQALTERQRRMVCPADFFGQSREYRCGPCQKCIQPAGGGARS